MVEPSDDLLQFPCDFPIKVMGRAGGDFDTRVVALVRRHAPDLSEGAVSLRASKGAHYLSVTVTIRATSRVQLDAIYRDLHTCPDVLMAL